MKNYTLLDGNGSPYQSPEKGNWGGHRRLKGFGRLDCPSALRWISRGYYVRHRVFFATQADAIDAGYRPCHTCQPDQYRHWKADPEAYREQILLPLRGAFNFREILRHLARSPLECGHAVKDEQVIKLFELNGAPAVITVEAHPEGLVLHCKYRRLTFAEKQNLRQRVTDWLDLQTDLTPFYDHVAGDPILGKVIKQYHGLRLVGIPDLFEALSWAIMGQQINLSYAYQLKHRFAQAFGRRVTLNGEDYLVYPAAEAIARQPLAALSQVLPWWKAEYIRAAAQAVASGQISKDQLKAAAYPQARETLLRMRGVGNWTANYVLMKCLRYPQAFPAEDAGLHNAIRQLASLDRKPTRLEVKRYAQSWTGWQAYATFYCWQTLLKA